MDDKESFEIVLQSVMVRDQTTSETWEADLTKQKHISGQIELKKLGDSE